MLFWYVNSKWRLKEILSSIEAIEKYCRSRGVENEIIKFSRRVFYFIMINIFV